MTAAAGPQRYGCIAIVPAGGSGSRFGASTPKQLHQIVSAPVLGHTLRALRQCKKRLSMFSLVPADEDRADAIVTRADNATVCGAQGRRADTVRNALAAVAKLVRRDAWVLVHDAARPSVGKADLDRLIAMLRDHSVGGLLAVPVSDTLKRADEAGGVAGRSPRTDGGHKHRRCFAMTRWCTRSRHRLT